MKIHKIKENLYFYLCSFEISVEQNSKQLEIAVDEKIVHKLEEKFHIVYVYTN